MIITAQIRRLQWLSFLSYKGLSASYNFQIHNSWKYPRLKSFAMYHQDIAATLHTGKFFVVSCSISAFPHFYNIVSHWSLKSWETLLMGTRRDSSPPRPGVLLNTFALHWKIVGEVTMINWMPSKLLNTYPVFNLHSISSRWLLLNLCKGESVLGEGETAGIGPWLELSWLHWSFSLLCCAPMCDAEETKFCW